MMQAGRGLDLGEEALRPQQGRQLRLHDLDRYHALVFHVLRQPDRGHAAGTELALDPVAVGQGGGEAVDHGAR